MSATRDVAISDGVLDHDADHEMFLRLLDQLPSAAYACDADGLLTYFNQRATEVWGRTPQLRDPGSRYCGSWRLFAPDGTPLPHEECWMALALQQRREYLGHEILVQRPDSTVVTVLAFATPVLDADGQLVAGLNVLVDIGDRKRKEQLLRDANDTKDQYMATLADELRAQLCAMQAQIAAVGPDAADADAAWEALAGVRKRLEQMENLIDDLLDVPRDAADGQPGGAGRRLR